MDDSHAQGIVLLVRAIPIFLSKQLSEQEMDALVLLSGPSAVGKTAVASPLASQFGFARVSTSAYLKELAAARGEKVSKASLQAIGDEMDGTTDFGWVADRAQLAFEEHPGVAKWLLDSVRKERQVQIFRQRFGRAIMHIHLTAPEEVLRQRYESRRAADDDHTSYDEMAAHPNEVSSRSLIRLADFIFDTSKVSSSEIVVEILSILENRGE